MKQGEIYLVDLFGDGRSRPVIVVSANRFNGGNSIVVIPLTTRNIPLKRELDNVVYFRAGEFGLDRDSVAQCEQISRIPKYYIGEDGMVEPLGSLDPDAWAAVVSAIGSAIGAVCNPDESRME
jgi:mRNA-degrading endonuclease toxin of MazEF toxin-antitoxin module